MSRVLLHTCCGPCATRAIEVLQAEHEVTLFFSNSNISPVEEYERRLAAARRLADLTGTALVVDPYDHESWLQSVAGLEDEPEKGQRCEVCFRFNLTRAAAHARENGFDAFTTTLTTSPHKPVPVIFAIGETLGDFLPVAFRKGDGYMRSLELSREYGLYRQADCGCEFSRRDTSAAE